MTVRTGDIHWIKNKR